MVARLSRANTSRKEQAGWTPEDHPMVTITTPHPDDEIVDQGARRKIIPSGKSTGEKKKNVMHDDPADWTDYEDGDEKEYTDQRRNAKDARYKDRLVERRKHQPLHMKDGNKQFVADFNEAVSSKKQQALVHKYTRTLFSGRDNWLEFIMEGKNGNFLLDDLVDWTGPWLQHPGSPDGWLARIPER